MASPRAAYSPGEFEAWSTIIVRHGGNEPLAAFTHVVGDPLPGCPRIKATKLETNLLKPRSIGQPFHAIGFAWQAGPVAPANVQDELPDGRRLDYPVSPDDVRQIAERAKAVLYLGEKFAIQIDLRNVSVQFNPAIIESLGPIEAFWLRVRWKDALQLGVHPAGGSGSQTRGVVPVMFRLRGFVARSAGQGEGGRPGPRTG
jgi:hypothetical protein